MANTVLRLELTHGGAIELVRTPGQPDVIIFIDSGPASIAVDLTAGEVLKLATALGEVA